MVAVMGVHLNRLREAMRQSRRTLSAYREVRKASIEEYVGPRYGSQNGNERNPTPINLLELMVNTYLRHLAAKAPEVEIRTIYEELKPMAYTFELAVNHLIGKEIGLVATLRRMVLDAIFGIGVVKVGLNRSRTVEIGGFMHDIGQPFADTVSLDDWVFDTSAKRWESITFAGDRYRIPLETVRNCDIYDRAAREKVKAVEMLQYDEEGEERVSSLGGDGSNADEFKDHTELWDIWLPQEGVLITVPSEDDTLILREVAWEGPESGPYYLLNYSEVPDNIMPLSNVSLLMDLHLLVNKVFEKVSNQALRQKRIGMVRPGGEKDAERIVNAPDGSVIRTDDPKNVGEMVFGGADGTSLAFALQGRDLFTWLGGNIDALAGLSPQADTVGQERLILGNASKRLSDMADRTQVVATSIIEALAWYLWSDPLIELPLVKRVEGVNVDIPTVFSADALEGDFLDYNFKIQAHSMQQLTPSEKWAQLMAVMQGAVFPILPMIQEQGGSIDVAKLLEIAAKNTNMPELREIVKFPGQLPPRLTPIGQAPAHRAMQSPVTTRREERISRPGATRQGKDSAVMQALMGQKVQPAEAAGAFRAIG